MKFQNEFVNPESWIADFKPEDVEIVTEIEHIPKVGLWFFEVILNNQTGKKYFFEPHNDAAWLHDLLMLQFIWQ
jgi:hypothetical protein